MNISDLVTAFQKFAEPQDKSVGANSAPAQSPVPQPKAADSTATDADRTDDIVTVSPEAVFLFAASQFDPQRLDRRQVRELADTLRDGGAISQRDHAILSSPPDPRSYGSEFDAERDPTNATDLINEFQGRLAYDMAQSDIAAVEADTRVLAILGRLSSIREEIL